MRIILINGLPPLVPVIIIITLIIYKSKQISLSRNNCNDPATYCSLEKWIDFTILNINPSTKNSTSAAIWQSYAVTYIQCALGCRKEKEAALSVSGRSMSGGCELRSCAMRCSQYYVGSRGGVVKVSGIHWNGSADRFVSLSVGMFSLSLSNWKNPFCWDENSLR
jgi:hypothetical protein